MRNFASDLKNSTLKRNEIILVALMALLNFTHILDFMIIMPLGNYPALTLIKEQAWNSVPTL